MARSISDIAKEISDLDRAHKAGTLSDVAYEAAKAALLDEMKAASASKAPPPAAPAPPPVAAKPPEPVKAEPAVDPTPRYLRYAAAGSAFLLALGLFGLSIFQVLIGFGLAMDEFDGVAYEFGQGSVAMWLTAVWNMLIVVLHVVIGVGVLQRKRWAYNWGIGTGTINAGLTVINVCMGACLLVPLLPLDIMMAVFLYMAKSEFQTLEQEAEAFASVP